MDLSLMKRIPHWSYGFFTENAINIDAVARALGLSYTYTGALLRGAMRITPENEAKLRSIVETLKRQQAEPKRRKLIRRG